MTFTADIAVLIPCYNESVTIADVVRDFRAALPSARVYVFDNASTDDTARIAREAGAIVASEPRKGKGNVVRRMFSEVDADIYVMVDGDGTYDASGAPKLVQALLESRADMAVGTRQNVTQDAGRKGHAFGNRIFNMAYRTLFGREFSDIFSGYRAFSRRFAKSFPALSSGFEIETEMSVFASQLRLPVVEVELPYDGKRPEGSTSKLSSVKDGLRIGFAFIRLFRVVSPTAFFGSLAALLALGSVTLFIPILIEFAQTGLVPRIPTAILCTGMMIVAMVFAACGIIVSAITHAQAENKRLFYLGIPANRFELQETRNDAVWTDIETGDPVRAHGGGRVSA